MDVMLQKAVVSVYVYKALLDFCNDCTRTFLAWAWLGLCGNRPEKSQGQLGNEQQLQHLSNVGKHAKA